MAAHPPRRRRALGARHHGAPPEKARPSGDRGGWRRPPPSRRWPTCLRDHRHRPAHARWRRSRRAPGRQGALPRGRRDPAHGVCGLGVGEGGHSARRRSTTSRKDASRTSCSIASIAPCADKALRRENENLRAQVRERFGLPGLIASSAAMADVLDLVGRVAPTGRDGADPRGIGDGQGGHRQGPSPRQSPRERPFRGRQLRGAARDAARVGDLRARQGCVHRAPAPTRRASSRKRTAARCSSTRSAR